MGHRARRAWWAVAVLGLVVGMGGRSSGGVIFDTLASPSATVYQVAGRPIALSFTTGDGPSTITDVTLKLARFGDGHGSITVSLLGDAGQTPGGVLATIGTLADSAVAVTGFDPAYYADYRISIASSLILTANTRYWLQVGSDNGSQIAWSQGLYPGGTGTSGEFAAFTSGPGAVTISPNGYNKIPTQMRLTVADADPVTANPSAVPEPSSLALCLAGATVVLARAARTRRRRTSASA